MIISVDMGKYKTKSVSEKGRVEFLTRVARTEETEITNGGHIIEFKGERYLINDTVKNIASFDPSKKTIEHKMAMFLAISKHIEDFADVSLAVGIPIEHWLNKQTRDDYRNFLTENETVEILVNKELKKFFIKDITILPESVGAIYTNPSQYKNQLVAVLDIGNLNINGAIFDNRKPYDDFSFTNDKGVSNLIKIVGKQLGGEYTTKKIQDIQIPTIIRDGLFHNGKRLEEADKIIRKAVDDYLTDIILDCKSNNFDLSSYKYVVIIGGGAKLLEKYIKEDDYIPHATILDDAEFANAIGFYNLGRALYSKKQEV